MGINRFYLKENNFVLTKFRGNIDNEILGQHVNELMLETKDIPDFKELSDCRDIGSVDELSVMGTTSSAKSELCHSDSLLAILIKDDDELHFGLARAYQMFALNTRKDVKIFTSLDEALIWLANDEKEIGILKNFVDQNQQTLTR